MNNNELSEVGEQVVQEKYFACYKYYNANKKRLAIFARRVGGNQMEFWIWACHKKDSFFKKKARDFYETYINYPNEPLWMNDKKNDKKVLKRIKPVITTIPLDGSGNTKVAFQNYIKENFTKRYPIWKVVGYKYMKHTDVRALFEMGKEII